MSDARLFVYGSLRRAAGHAMGEVLAAAAVLEGEARVHGRLYAIDGYPGLVLDDDAGDVLGEVWRLEDLDVLARLDAYEGCGKGDAEPHEFRRVRTTVRRVEADPVEAWVYVYAWPVDEGSRVPSGDWLSAGC